MKFKIDENLPAEFAEILRQAGHDAKTVYDEELQGKVGPVIAEACRDGERILLTRGHFIRCTRKSLRVAQPQEPLA